MGGRTTWWTGRGLAAALAVALVAMAGAPAAPTYAVEASAASATARVTLSAPDTAQEGQLVPITITVTNTSGTDMIGTGFFAYLPPVTAARFRDVAGATCRIDRNVQITCSGGPLANGASAQVVADVIPTATGPMLIEAWGSVETAGINWIGTGSTSVTVPVGPGPTDLQISGSASTGSPVAGATFQYTYQVKNSGPVTAYGVTLTEVLPAGMVFVGADLAGCGSVGGTVTCGLGDLAAAGQARVTISVQAPSAAGKYTTVASVAASAPDAKPANNSVSTTIQVK